MTLGANVFVEAKRTIDTDIPNVIYPDANSNLVCDNVVITDREAFFCPKEIKAKNLSYTREFKAGNNTVCLPFALSKELNSSISYICTYDSEEDGTFWFTSKATGVAANTPVLLVTKEACSLDLTDVNIPVGITPDDQKVKGSGANGSLSYGVFKLTARDEILGAANGEKVYGLSGDKFQPATQSANFPSFRMVLCSATKANAASAAPRQIRVRDEQGREINIGGGTSAIEEVSADAPAFSVKGGVGEIIIISESNYGKVEVYALDGRVAAIADVTEGTTSVNVQHGLYIVMGKKVIVK